MPFAVTLALLLFATVPVSGQLGSSPDKPTKIVLTRIDATKATGLCLRIDGNGLLLTDLKGDPATKFAVDSSSLVLSPDVAVNFTTIKRTRKYLSAKQTWKLTDRTGAGVEIVDNTLQALIIISRVDRSITLKEDGSTYTVPAHAFVLVNSPSKTAVLDYGADGWLGFTGHYVEKMSPILRPTEVVISPNDQGITGGFPAIAEDTLCDQPTNLSGT